MKRDEIATGEAVPNDPDYRTSLAVDLAVALAGFVNACADIPPRGGARHISVFVTVTMEKIRFRRALNAFCDAHGVERL